MNKEDKACVFYVDARMNEWRMSEQPRRVRACVRRVMNELHATALLTLKDPRFEVRVLPEDVFSVWAYFPVHRRRSVAKRLHPKPETRILLVLSTAHLEKQPMRQSEDELRDHLGHTLLYLRNPKARNECGDALKEWGESTRRVA